MWTRLLRPIALNDVETGESDWYPELEPRRYRAAPKTVFRCAREVVTDHERWELRSAHPDERRLEAEAQTRVFRLVDDITIQIRAESDPTWTTVNVRSRSRLGQADLGQNARNIRQFFDRLDRRVDEAVDHEGSAE